MLYPLYMTNGQNEKYRHPGPSNSITDPGVSTTATGTVWVRQYSSDKNVDQNEVNHTYTIKPVVHPDNESQMKFFPRISSQYATCSLFIRGFINQITNELNETNETHEISSCPLAQLNERTVAFVVQIIENFFMESLIVDKGQTQELYPSSEFVFNYVVIEEDAILTSKNQGVVCIQCFDLIIKRNGLLHLNGKGYYGGLPENQGGSYTGLLVRKVAEIMNNRISPFNY